MPSSAPLAGRAVIRWGIIGCGDVTEVKSGPGFRHADRSHLVAVMRRNGALAADYAKRHGVPRWYDDARVLVNDREVDAVYIASWPGAHVEGALLAAAAGKPAYVEKPMARNTPECDTIVDAFARAKQKLFVAYYRRALPRFLRIQELIQGGTLGALTSVRYRMSTSGHLTADAGKIPWRLSVENSGGGLLLDVGSHTLDLIDFFTGPMRDIHSNVARLASPSAVEDAVSITFRTAAGVPGAASWNFASLAREDWLEFSGTLGRVSLGVFNHEPARLETARGVELLDLPNPVHIQQPMIQTVVDDLLGLGTCASTGESGRRTSAVMDHILGAYYGGRSDSFWSRPQSWPGARKTPAAK